MRRTRSVLVLLALASLLPACYMSPEPLEPSTGGPLDARLSGSWACKDPDSQETASLLVMPFDASQYYVEWRESHKLSRYRAYASEIGARRLLNVTELAPKPDGEWAFFRYQLDAGGDLRLSLVSDDALHGLKGRSALAEIRRRVGDETLYEGFAVCQPQS